MKERWKRAGRIRVLYYGMHVYVANDIQLDGGALFYFSKPWEKAL